MELTRSFGVLLHPTSLPSRFGVGDLGPAAHDYLDWLQQAGASWWQVLPLNPPGAGESPYSAKSTFAGNALLVSPERLVEDGLLEPSDLASPKGVRPGRVAWSVVAPARARLLHRAWERFRSAAPAALADAYTTFAREQAWWLDDYALYSALRDRNAGAAWSEWPRGEALRDEATLEARRRELAEPLDFVRFCQMLFFRQWDAVHLAARERGIRILGDLPIFVDMDSADVWAHRELFQMDAEGRRRVVAGVPPDYFSKTGQLWGNPLYDWELMQRRGFRWWTDRLRHTLATVDAVRIDHFRGLAAYWAVPADAETAQKGRWVPGPGQAFFEAVRSELGHLPLLAEDLGHITSDVIELRRRAGLPGMVVLQFAFNPHDRSTYLPYNHRDDVVVYTGTHDNNTTVGWYRDEASEEEKDFARRYMASDGAEIHWDMIRLACSSIAPLAIVPHQDIAGLGSEARMNSPGHPEGNWSFRLEPEHLAPHLRDRLADLVWVYGRRP